MQEFDEEGQLDRDVTNNSGLSGCLNAGSFVSQRGKIFGVGLKKLSGNWDWQMEVYDGKKWAFS